MSDLIDRQQALDAIRKLQTYKLFEGDDMILVDKADVQTELMMLPSASPDLSEEDMRLIKKLRSFHNGSYAVVLDKLITSACNETKQQATVSSDCISREDAIVSMAFGLWSYPNELYTSLNCFDNCQELAERVLNRLPSAESERDIPIKPIETHDKAWGIPSKQAVCPKCDYYLGHVAFLGDYKGKRITYCETCGQAIDWEGWDFDE